MGGGAGRGTNIPVLKKSQAMLAFRLDLVRFLLINCKVRVLQSDREVWCWLCSLEDLEEDKHWCEVRDVLSRVLDKIADEDIVKEMVVIPPSPDRSSVLIRRTKQGLH